MESLGRQKGIAVLSSEFEDAWNRGQHDGEEVASTILRLVAGSGFAH